MPRTPAPTSTTSPTSSCPKTAGALMSGDTIFAMSEPQSPQPPRCSSSSPAPIDGRGQSSAAIRPLPRKTAAFTPRLSNLRSSHRSPRRPTRLGSHDLGHLTARLGRRTPRLALPSRGGAQAGARPAAQGDGDLAPRRQGHTLLQDRKAAVRDLAEQRVIAPPHDLGGDQRAGVDPRK